MKRLMALGLALALSGCMASLPVQREIVRQVTIPSTSFDQVWNAALDIFAQRNWTVANLDKSSGFLNSDWLNVAPATGFFDCGKPGMATYSGFRGRFNILVRQPDPTAGIQLTVNSTFQATSTFMDSSAQFDCVSTGVLERQIHETIQSRVNPSAR